MGGPHRLMNAAFKGRERKGRVRSVGLTAGRGRGVASASWKQCGARWPTCDLGDAPCNLWNRSNLCAGSEPACVRRGPGEPGWEALCRSGSQQPRSAGRTRSCRPPQGLWAPSAGKARNGLWSAVMGCCALGEATCGYRGWTPV